ncbi:hypothetical protein AB6A40_003086 [Gnathostoma spinigerum]|uniref:Uncharacterized protein n=1 Tax=Gnathostoma spinigerum TaxID=75299 RepID=A0ABD6EAS6_9BILA
MHLQLVKCDILSVFEGIGSDDREMPTAGSDGGDCGFRAKYVDASWKHRRMANRIFSTIDGQRKQALSADTSSRTGNGSSGYRSDQMSSIID